MLEKIKNDGITGMQLKILALVSMTIDHMGAVLFPTQIWMRVIGRLAFPIYCFLLVEGFYYTKSRKKYLIRLLLFAIISEIPFDLAVSGKLFAFEHQNVLFTLFIGFLIMYFCEYASSEPSRYLMCFAGLILAGILRTDYSYFGIAMILIFYLFRNQKLQIILWQSVINVFGIGSIQSWAVVSLVPIWFYKGKEGRKFLKFAFYAYYPLHLFILYLISVLVW